MPEKTLIVIPARLDSKRLPGKVLLDETGMTVVGHVAHQCERSLADHVMIATSDDPVIDAVVGDFCVIRTVGEHSSGTSRAAEAARKNPEYDLVLVVQADLPEVDPAHLDHLILSMRGNHDYVATLSTPWPAGYVSADPGDVKVVVDADRFALYFSRQPLPGSERHLGVYGFRRETLIRYPDQVSRSPLAAAEDLEQLAWLEHIVDPIRVYSVPDGPHSIDTRSDYRDFVARWKAANP